MLTKPDTTDGKENGEAGKYKEPVLESRFCHCQAFRNLGKFLKPFGLIFHKLY